MSVGCLAFGGALGADALNHIIDGLGAEAIGQIYGWNRNILKAEGTVACFAMKMHVAVVINIAVSVAKFVSDTLAAVINLVQEMVLIEQGESAEYAGFINGVNGILKFRHSNGAVAVSQRFKNQQPVGCGLDTVLV